MKIPPNGSVPSHLRLVRETATPEAQDGAAGSTPAAPQPQAAPRTDSVQFSLAGRALAKADPTGERPPLSPERVAELRKKVLEGAYNSVDAAEQVARRILDRGDL